MPQKIQGIQDQEQEKGAPKGTLWVLLGQAGSSWKNHVQELYLLNIPTTYFEWCLWNLWKETSGD